MEKLEILITEADKYSGDVREMSDFFGAAFSNIKHSMSDSSLFQKINIPLTGLGSINCVYDGIATVSGEKTSYVLNFDALPKNIKEKLDSKEYVLGDSKQVKGDLRAVIIDKKTNTRIKDVTVQKRTEKIPGKEANPNALNNLFVQAQLKQIIEKIEYMSTMQDYQIKRDRDRDFIEPFFKARDEIRSAQETDDYEIRKNKLESALKYLNDVSIAAYQDSLTSSQKIVENKASLFFGTEVTLRKFMGYVAEDWFYLAKSASIKLRIYDYLKNYVEFEEVMKDFIFKSYEFCNKKFSNNKYSYAMYLNLVAPYSSKDVWGNLINTTNREFEICKLFEKNKEVEYLEIKEA